MSSNYLWVLLLAYRRAAIPGLATWPGNCFLRCGVPHMDSGYYVAAAGLAAQTQALDVIANNLANLGTTGYRKQQAIFRSLMNSSIHSSPGAQPALSAAINNFGVLGGSRVDLSAGTLAETGNPLDVGFSGDGFFTIQQGAGTVYTRNGNFHVSRDGYLVTSDGSFVLGAEGKVTVPAGEVAISGDGTISVDGAIAGQLRLAGFQPGTVLTAAGGANLTTSAVPGVAAGAIRQRTLENSNASPVEGMIDLITAQRNAEMLSRALSALDGQLNQTAAQQLGRVTG